MKALEEQLLKDLEFHGIAGRSPAMLEVFDFAEGGTALHNVLLAGPTGTGKELVARSIHQLSPLSQQKLAVCNCSAMVDTLLESQLFARRSGEAAHPAGSRDAQGQPAEGRADPGDRANEPVPLPETPWLRHLEGKVGWGSRMRRATSAAFLLRA